MTIDIIILIIYFLVTIVLGLWRSKSGAGSTEEYFLSGRKLPWYLAGLSMVATTFSADTPLVVTGIIAKKGIAGNWVWFSFLFSGMLTVFFYAKLWRRSRVMTDAEFAELRYEGKAASFLRTFRAIYLAIPINLIIMGWVTTGMIKVMIVAFGWPVWQSILLLYGITALYILFSGLWGVVLTDAFQFVIAMAGSIALAYFSLDKTGGIDALNARLGESGKSWMLSFSPFSPEIGYQTALVWLALQWWVSWYPGAEPGGGGYVAQRILSTKDEQNAGLSALVFNIAHYALRPWPWIITALVVVSLPLNGTDAESGYAVAMKKYLPAGWYGLMLAAFLSAFMSTLSTHLNWGASYIVNDVLRLKAETNAEQKKTILISRLSIVALMGGAILVSRLFGTVKESWEILISIGAGTGPVYLLRWYWRRINAYSEISAMGAAFIVTILLNLVGIEENSHRVLISTLYTTVIWVTVTFLTPPVSDAKLQEFYTLVRPPLKIGWKKEISSMKADNSFLSLLLDYCISVSAVLLALFGTGTLLLKDSLTGILMLSSSVVLGIFLFHKGMKKSGKE